MIVAFANMHSTRGFSLSSWLMSWVIKLWTKSRYFHTEIIFNGYWYTADVYSGKVIKRRLRPLKTSYDYTYVNLTKEQFDTTQKYLTFMMSHKYDLKTIFYRQVLGIKYNSVNDVYCTELALKLLRKLELCEYPDDGTITPAKFFKCTSTQFETADDLPSLERMILK